MPIRLRSLYSSVYNDCLSTTVFPSQLLAKAFCGFSPAESTDTAVASTTRADIARLKKLPTAAPRDGSRCSLYRREVRTGLDTASSSS